MLRRLVIALTTLLSLVGAVVVAGYLLIFAAGADRAAAALPAGADAYLTVYLQPSTGQQLNLASMLGQVPGFEDAAGLDQKIHEISARFLGQAGIDYEADVRPWLGNQLAMAAFLGDSAADPPRMVLVVAVKDRVLAEASLSRLAAGRGLSPLSETYEGMPISVDPSTAWALLDDQLLVAADRPTLEASLDAAFNRRPSLADDAGFQAAMRRLPPDHLAAGWVDLAGLAGSSGTDAVASGYSSLGVAVVADPGGLRLEGSAPFQREAASDEAREAFELGAQVPTVTDWMPAETQASAVVFGLRRILQDAEGSLAAAPGGDDLLQSLNQLRALAGFGLGINLDRDVLPLLDGEVGLAISGLSDGRPHGQLIVRPPDLAAASATLDRLRDALAGVGATISERPAAGMTVLTVEVPQVGSASWVVAGDVILAGLTYEDVAAALAAHEASSVADGAAYQAAWQLTGDRGGNELFVDIGSIADRSPDTLGMTGDARDILLSISALGVTIPARDDTSQLRAVLTVR